MEITLTRSSRLLDCYIAVGVIVVASAACGSSGGSTEQPPVIDDSIARGVPVSLSVTAQDLAFIQAAADREIEKCMSAQGFNWPAVPIDVFLSQAQTTLAERLQLFPYDVSDEGPTYTPVPPAGGLKEETPTGISEAELTRYSIALIGTWSDVASVEVLGSTLETSSDGCITEARIAVFESLEVAYFIESEGSNVLTRAANMARQSPEVAGRVDAWSKCMSRSGYEFEGFADARSAGSSSSDGHAIAREDGKCTSETGLLESFNEAFAEQMYIIQEQHQGELERLVTERDLAVARSKLLLGIG